MTFSQYILCIVFPPLAVLNKGCGSMLIVLILTMFGWIPGIIGALVIVNSVKDKGNKAEKRKTRQKSKKAGK